jgi:hypothetical protein
MASQVSTRCILASTTMKSSSLPSTCWVLDGDDLRALPLSRLAAVND